jgi:hypothetical protein
MRTGKELILASKEFIKEDRAKSWSETLITIFLLVISLGVTFLDINVFVRLGFSVLC